ncbi:MAG TPA: hypothetical protein VJ728_03845 [Candidatus Binataceae bacterium]|nr:hypothetical protein [Candidatus Binataceae bacterium]
MAEVQPRYEYRVWADALEEQKDQLRRLAPALRTESSEEIYLISLLTDSYNVKLRSGQIRIKALLAMEQGLELWKPVLDADFPLDRALIADQIFPCFELPAPVLDRPEYLMEDFFTEIIRPISQIAILTTFKTRVRFRLNECLAEFTSVTVDKARLTTVAVESIRAEGVLQLIRELRIDGMPNINYVRRLKQVLENTGLARFR